MVILAGCANPINSHTKHEYESRGSEWEHQGDYKEVDDCYRRALINAKGSNLGPAEESQAMYNFARMTGYLGNFEEAERLLLESLALEKKATGTTSQTSCMRYFELARLQFDQHNFEKAATYYEKAIAIADASDTERKRPVALAAELDKYALSLSRISQDDRARVVQARADKLRSDNPGKKPEWEPTHYNVTYASLCRQNGDWEKAFELLEKALANVEAIDSTAGSEGRAYICYEYGRAAGVTCRFDSAHQYLKEAYEINVQNSGHTYMDLVELARLQYDQHYYDQANTYFVQAIAAIEEKNMTSRDPLGFAEVLDEYSNSLIMVKQLSEADAMQKKAAEIRNANPQGKSKIERTPYGRYCQQPS